MKSILTSLAMFFCASISFAQSNSDYLKIIIDGKPAFMHVTTGMVTYNLETHPKDSAIHQKSSNQDPRLNADKFHRVEPGDTYYGISKKHGISLDQLLDWNQTSLNTVLSVGKILKTSPTVPFSSITNTYSPNSIKEKTHTVLKGETLYNISKRYGLTIQQLKSKNNLKETLISIGQTLYID